ncbi:MAG: TetR/AcrR family transcriptional regulator [Alphaproteobacteria bacterium]|nr:TetR/AcrR family transcriptional regulator [Alphaproteobacteria bacterium]
MADHRDHYHHGNLREALLDAAECMIVESGVAGLSLRQVAKHAGVSQAAPYHHFASKEALLAEVARRGFAKLVAGLSAAATEPDPIARMAGLGAAYVQFGLENPAVYRLMFGAEFCPTEVFPELKESGDRAFSILMEAVAHGQALGVFWGDEPSTPSFAVWSSVHGLVSLLMARVPPEKVMHGVPMTHESMMAATMAFIIAGLRGERVLAP